MHSHLLNLLGVSLLQTSLVNIMPDVVHPRNSWSSFARVPLTSIFIVCFTLFSSSIRRLCPHQRNLACLTFNAMFSTPKSLRISSLLSLSRIVTHLIRHNILISVVSIKKNTPRTFLVPIILLYLHILLR